MRNPVANWGRGTIVAADFSHGPGTGRLPSGTLLISQHEEAIAMFISPAYAQSGTGGAGDLFNLLVPMLMVFVIFYFFMIRPQQQRMKQHKETINNIRRGDTVVTSGGIVGKVTKVKDDGEIEVEIADNTRVRVIKDTIAQVRTKGEPVKETA
jgi:preprotein translocase subunit YajC